MVDSKEGSDNSLENSPTLGPADPNKEKEVVVVDSVSSEEVSPPAVSDFPDGGLTAWLVVVGVCTLLTITNTLC